MQSHQQGSILNLYIMYSDSNDGMSDQVKAFKRMKEEAQRKLFSTAMVEIVQKQLDEKRDKSTQTPSKLTNHSLHGFEVDRTEEIMLMEAKLQQQREQMEAVRIPFLPYSPLSDEKIYARNCSNFFFHHFSISSSSSFGRSSNYIQLP